MSQNINQVYIANPITSNAGTDLMYFGQSPYGAGQDAAMLYSNFATQLIVSGTQYAIGYYATAGQKISPITTANSATLVTSSTGVPAYTSSLTNGQVIVGSTGATPTPATLTAGANISIVNGAASITIATTGFASLSYDVNSNASISAAVNTIYIPTFAGTATITLPATCAVGNIIGVLGSGSGGWVLQAAGGQTIYVSPQATSVAGSLSSSASYDTLFIVCFTANTNWTTLFPPQTQGLTYL